MKIKNLADKITSFIFNRISELLGLVLLISSIFLLISLISYSPEDPNFIFSEDTEIKNLMGAKGSYASDILYQSIGLISLLVPFSFIFISLVVITDKKIFQVIESLFYVILYSVVGTLFFTVFHTETFWLTINGNNGFIGDLFEETPIINLINLNHKIIYIILIFLISLIFFFNNNFKLKYVRTIFSIFNKTKKEQDKNIFESSDEDLVYQTNPKYNETRIQENFSFDKNIETNDKRTIKYKLPFLEFLKIPTKKDKNLSENKIDEKSLEKILLDFGVEGEIKKVSKGPVVTLYEFEPAPGVKVSKIINLSEDIARNTSSESARIATIPGSNTIGMNYRNHKERMFS